MSTPKPSPASSSSSALNAWYALASKPEVSSAMFFFFKQKTAYEIGLGIPAEPLFRSQKELTKMQLDNQKEIAEMQNETQKEIAGIQSATSRQNTKDQVYAQNEMLAYQQKESTARV